MNLVKKLVRDLYVYLRDIFLQWIWPFAIFVKDENDRPVVDSVTGKYLVNWTATAIARLLSVVTAVWGTTEVLGIPLFQIVATILSYFGFVN